MISRGYDWENKKRRGSVVGGLRAMDIIEHKDRKNWLKSRIYEPWSNSFDEWEPEEAKVLQAFS